MSEHVLECRWESQRCICDELRAIQKRVMTAMTEYNNRNEARVRSETLEAAEAAVEAVVSRYAIYTTSQIIAAIRALKEKS